MTKEEIVMATVQEELAKDEVDVWAVFNLFKKSNLDQQKIQDIVDTWSDSMKDKLDNVIKRIDSVMEILSNEDDEELNG